MDKVFLRPLLSAVVMGIDARFIYDVIHRICIKNMPGRTAVANALGLLISILIAVMIYAFMVLRVGDYKEEELLDMPKGALIVKVAKKLRLLK